MSSLHLTYVGHVSDRVADLYYGVVKPEGIDFHFISAPPHQAFNRLLRGEFQCGEMSFSTYVIQAAQAKKNGTINPLIAIPVFPSRTFRHGAIYVNRKAGIGRPQDLAGRRVGVPEYQMTAAVWARGMLKHEYDVRPESIQWTTGGLTAPGRRPLIESSIPGIDIRHEEQKTLNDMLVSGELDAVIAPQMPPAFRSGREEVARLFSDVPQTERAYFAKTGLFPIMHTLVLRREFYDQHPWVAVSLYKAFEQAKDNCLQGLRVEEPLPVSLPWIYEHGQTVRDLMGVDYWPYGIDKNKKVIAALCDYTWEQGLAPVKVEVEDLFAPSVAYLSGDRL